MSRNTDGAPRARGANYFDVGVVGRRTGITMKANVKKDEDGLDNIDDFWADEDEDEDENVDQLEDENIDQLEDEQENSEHGDGNHSEDRSTYYDQDLPEELLATPTSRRSRAVPMTNSGSRRGLLSSTAFDHGAEEYQSPSFHAVKKRLVFTKDAPNAGAGHNSSDRESSSPALDRLLNVSKQKALLAKAAPSPGYLSKLAQTKGVNKPTPSYISKALGTNRPGFNKAFDLGSDDNVASGGSDNSDEEPASRPAASRPTKATPQRKTAKSVKTPVEVRRKPKALPPPSPPTPSPPPETHDDDHEYREERASNDHNGFTFSDEEDRRPSRKDSEGEEEEQPLIDRRKTKSVQSKTQVKETKTGNGTTKSTSRTNIPKKPVKPPTTKKPAAKSTSRAKKISVSDRSDRSGSDSDDHRVPTSRKATTQKGKTISSAPKAGLIEIPVVPEAHEPDGTRKSSRTRLQPLEWWKNEKVVLGKSDVQGVAEIKAVIKAPAVEERPLGTTKRKATKRPASKSTTNGHVAKKRVRGPDSDMDDVHVEPVVDGEEEDRLAIEEQGLKEEPEQMVDTVDWNTGETISRRVAESKSVAAFNKVQGGGYQYHRGLEDVKYIVSGKMRILPGGQKPVGNGAKTSMVFYVISGAAQVCVNKTEFALSTGGSFLIPKGNVYSFTNLSSKRDLILFFVQSRQQEGAAAATSAASGASTPVLTGSKGTTVEYAQAAAQAAAAAAATAAKPKPKAKPKSKATRTTRRRSTSAA
ncbi:hypothetical protein BGZ74_004069 [Mortierella antarctica]|nr:hypothetical protein BGZ74_004069 [Mortierella antarctica]